MVDLSDHGDLMTKFLALPLPRMFMYGAENASLTYLPKPAEGGVELAGIPHTRADRRDPAAGAAGHAELVHPLAGPDFVHCRSRSCQWAVWRIRLPM
ncbi:hypothetical protein [Streptomyces sp. NPDC001292]|uniref:hypothetical protein n=1 Tax=Streptomyces sp. NPDC001292 TaxID=3364558 RepID=UPI0036D185A4